MAHELFRFDTVTNPILCVVLTITVSFIGYIFYLLTRSPKNQLPDGSRESEIERGWPILGVLPKINEPLCNYLLKLGQKHGDLFRIKFGMRNIYVLNNFTVLKKCLKDDNDNFSGRWKGKIIELGAKNSGILSIDGDVWAQHRSFILKVFRDFGLGKSRTIEIVQEECRHLLCELESKEKQSVNFSDIIPIYTLNIISKFIMNRRFARDDKDFKLIDKVANMLVKKQDKFQRFLFLFPFWDHSVLLTQISRIVSFRKPLFQRIYKIFRGEINNHAKVLDLNSECQDLIDRFLVEQSKLVNKTGTVLSFTEFQLIRSSLELFIAGYETTSTTLGWSLLFLSHHPDIQQKMHDEIVEHIGLEQLPSTIDKKYMTLTQAIMDEILRLSSVAPLSLVHRNYNDTVIDGIFIEGNSLIFPNLYACHRDARVWTKPLEFYPDHFLVTDNDGILKYNPREELVPFGLGKRQCLGESLARAEFFIFLVAIIQRFKVRFADHVSEKEYEKAVLGGDGQIRFSSIHDFVFEKYD